MLSIAKSWNTESWEKVRSWRGRTEELRQAAGAMAIPSRRDGLLQVADDYERMAADLEQELKASGVLG